MWRVFFGFISYLSGLLSITYLPISISTTGQQSTIFLTLILGYFFVGEKLSRREIACILCGFVGILMVIIKCDKKPDLNTIKKTDHNFILGFIASACYTFSQTLMFFKVRAIGDDIHPCIKNYYYGVLGIFITLLINIYLDPQYFAFW